MKHRLSSLAFARISTAPRTLHTPLLSSLSARWSLRYGAATQPLQLRSFAITARLGVKLPSKDSGSYEDSNARPVSELNNNITQEEKDDFAKKLQEDKGKLLTTPSRMLKIILPLTTKDTNTDRKDIEPLALLVHPQQPISYLERLIQAELPTITDKDGKERIPAVHFRAEDSMQDDLQASQTSETIVSSDSEPTEGEEDFEQVDEHRIDGKTVKTGKINSQNEEAGAITNRKTPDEAVELRGGHGKGGVESYSGLGQDAPSDKISSRKFVRWSSSTEIGDFIRDAARGQEFAIEIEGAPEEIRVGVPSFNDRTYYLRMRLRKTSKQISEMADIKERCDKLAHKAAQQVATAGFAGIVGWWGVVYYLTFQTELGWDVMEPVTYLVGLSTLIGGYVWFLYHNREVSYRSAMNFTISRRQSKLYTQHNFDLRKWEVLIEDGNALRKEIKAIANEYDVEWDEMKEEKDEKVAEALRKDRKRKEGKKDKDDDEPKAGKTEVEDGGKTK
ncbi:hypothetical protein M3J09_001859 [Ascochyta lentis]